MKQGRTPKDTDKAKALGKRIKIERIKRDLTQADLSQRTGISQRMVSNFERGVNVPNAFQIADIEKALCLPDCGRLICVMTGCMNKPITD